VTSEQCGKARPPERLKRKWKSFFRIILALGPKRFGEPSDLWLSHGCQPLAFDGIEPEFRRHPTRVYGESFAEPPIGEQSREQSLFFG
jgi:hypothetical protein